MLQPGETINGKYELIGMVGRGGMSAVYKARDLATGALLAIKDVERSKESGNQIFEERLTEEGHMLKNLSNEHLPRIYDIIENEHSFMLVMDFIEGESLDKVIARTGPQPDQRVYDWGMQICDVFTYLHSQNPPIIYRDMKPANIILQPDGKLMMIDFGTARTQKVGQQLSSDTICIGTEGFAAPEQYGGMGESDARTDIFCLGATLYNMITGHSPYDYPKGILPLERWDPRFAASPLNAIIVKCTQRSPMDRYQTAAELRADLALAASGRFKINKSGQLTQSSWQKLSPKTGGALNGLSGLLQRSIRADKKEEARPGEPVVQASPGWQVSPAGTATAPAAPTPQPQTAVALKQKEPDAAPEAQPEGVFKSDTGMWRNLMIVSVIGMILMLLLSAVFAVSHNSAWSVIFLIFAAAAICLTLIGVVMFIREQNQAGGSERNNS